MFGRSRISFPICKDYICSMFRCREGYLVEHDSPTSMTISMVVDRRRVSITLTQYKNNVIIDVGDAYGIIRIPKGKFKDFTKFREFCINYLSNKF